MAITLDQLERNANLDIRDADGRTVLWQKTGRGRSKAKEFHRRVQPRQAFRPGLPRNR